MEKLNLEAIAANILASNPKIDDVFMTSNGLGYTSKEAAEARQKDIDATIKVVEFKRAKPTAAAVKPEGENLNLETAPANDIAVDADVVEGIEPVKKPASKRAKKS